METGAAAAAAAAVATAAVSGVILVILVTANVHLLNGFPCAEGHPLRGRPSAASSQST